MDSVLTPTAEESGYEPVRSQPYLVPVIFDKELESGDQMKGTERSEFGIHVTRYIT